MTGDIDYEKIFGDGFLIIDPTDRVDLNDVIPCLPPVCPPVYHFTLMNEVAPVTEATGATCSCHMP